MSNVVNLAVPMIKAFEGCVLQAYPDPATHGDPWTVGYGATGHDIVPGTVWSQAQAEQDLISRVSTLAAQVDALLDMPLPVQCEAALVSFAYNVGITALKESTLLRLINAGHPVPAADEFLRWTHAAGHVMPALVARRTKERAAFLGGLNALGFTPVA